MVVFNMCWVFEFHYKLGMGFKNQEGIYTNPHPADSAK
jgi:hypothetical protein